MLYFYLLKKFVLKCAFKAQLLTCRAYNIWIEAIHFNSDIKTPNSKNISDGATPVSVTANGVGS